MGRSLDQRARDALIPEPIIFTVDPDGTHHLATETFPWRTAFLIHWLAHRPWIAVDEKAATVTITLDGRSATYRRRGYDIHGRWICDLAR